MPLRRVRWVGIMSAERAGDEEAVIAALMELVAERVRGQGDDVYGPLDLKKDPRSMVREALLEVVDALFYVGAELVKLDSLGVISELPRDVELAVVNFPGATLPLKDGQSLTVESGPAGVLWLLEFIRRGGDTSESEPPPAPKRPINTGRKLS